jgi:hypothetical protein
MKTTVSAALVLMFALPSALFSQASRTWISGVGDDINPCSRSLPCKTFQGALAKTQVGGEIDALESGGFGSVTITNSITIDGGGVYAGLLTVGGLEGITINAPNAEVVIRNLRLNGLAIPTKGGIGIRVLAAARVTIQNCYIANFSIAGIDVSSSQFVRLAISDTTIEKASAGVQFNTASGVSAELNHVNLWLNATGLFAANGSHVSVRDSDISMNSVTGVATSGSNVAVAIEGSTIARNITGINVAANTSVHLGRSLLTDNNTGIVGTVQSHQDNHISNNGAGGILSPVGTK